MAASYSLAKLILNGHLIPVQVFGTDHCQHGDDVDGLPCCEMSGFGLCDRFSQHAMAGSDCNRAEFFLLRPSDELMDGVEVRAAIQHVLDNDGWLKP